MGLGGKVELEGSGAALGDEPVGTFFGLLFRQKLDRGTFIRGSMPFSPAFGN
jgi:hypothetical protein